MIKNKKSSWGVDTRDMDTSIRPQDDFYHYANGGWIKKNSIPPHESRWGSFLILRYQTDKKLYAILKDLGKKNNWQKKTLQRLLHDFYNSGMDTKKRTELGMQPLVKSLAKIDRIKTPYDMIKTLAHLHTIGVGALWGSVVDQDSKKSDQHILHLYQDGLGMPERDYYIKEDTESKRVREAYKKHLSSLFRFVGKNNQEAEEAMETVVHIETLLAEASMSPQDFYDVEKTYNKKSFSSFAKSTKNILWDDYLAGIGVKPPKNVIIMQPDFFMAVHTLLEIIPLSQWRTYLACQLVNEYAPTLSPALQRQSFSFYGKVLQGTTRMHPLWRRVLSVVNASVGELLGQRYVEQYFTQVSKQKINAMVDDLFMAYEAHIKNLQWMSSITKRKAIKKLHALNRKIGYPDKWKSYRGLTIHPDEYTYNIMRSCVFEHKKNMRKLGKPIDKTEWHMYPQTVNAYFSPTLNDIVFPAAILQPPFFDINGDDAVNYGAIGSVIGHEMTHGFDDDGSKFDERGNMKNWWTTEDRNNFTKRTKLLERQFSMYRVSGNTPVNGKLTLGENIADLGGITIALDAYKLHCVRTKEKSETIDGFTPTQRLFIGFALFERELQRPEVEKMQVRTDPHSPGIFRINGIVANMKEFYEAFSVKKRDKLYRAPKNRTEIW